MNPYRLKNVFEYLTSSNQLLKRKLKSGTSEIPIPPKRQDVIDIEAINRFNKDNPRVDTTNIQPVVKPSTIKQSNVGEIDEGVIQGAFDTATMEARDGGYPAPVYEAFKKRYLKRNMKADGGRIGYNEGSKLTDFLDVQASGTKSGKQQIKGAPEGITSDKETLNAIVRLDVPISEKINLIGDLQYGKFRDKIEYNDNEIFLEDSKSYKDRNIGLDYNRGGEGLSGSVTVGDEGPEYEVRYKKSFADGGMLVKPSDDGSRPGYKDEKYISPSSTLKNVDIPEKTKQKYVTLLKGINKWKKDPSAENWIEIFRKGDGLNQTQESLNVRRYLTGQSYQGKDLFPQVKEHFEKMNLKKIIGPDVKLIKTYTKDYFKKIRQSIGTEASAVAKLANSADEVREIAPFFKRAKDPKKLNVLTMTKKLVQGYDSLNEYDKIAAIENVSKRVSRYLEFLEGSRKVGKLQKPQNAEEIISFIKSNMSDFEFGTSTIRNMKFSARDAALGLKRGTTRNTRAILYDLKQPNQVIDEVAGLSATYKNAPGYTELTQLISPEINQLKNTKIDVPLSSRFMKNIMAGDFKDKETYNKAAKLFMKENPGVDIPILVTGENLEPSKYIKNFEDLSPQAKKNITEIAKKNKFVFKTDALPIKSLIASLGGGTCSVFSGKKAKLKADGGRIGLQDGTPDIDRCYDAATAVINSGKVPVDKADDFAQLLKRVGNIGRGVMKYGIIPEALYATADSLVRMGMGDTFKEAGLRATDYLLPGDQTKAAEISKVSRVFGDTTGELVGRTIDYKNQLAKIQSLEDQKASLDNLSGGGEFDYIGDLTGDVKNTENLLLQAKNDLDNKFKISEAEQLFAESKQDDAYDASKANSFFTKLKARFRDSSDGLSDIETLAAPEKTQLQLNLNMLPNFREAMKDPEIRSNLNYANLPEKDVKEYFTSQGTPEKIDSFLQYQKDLKDSFSLNNLSNTFGKEQLYGTQGNVGEPLLKTIPRKENSINDLEREAVGQRNKFNIFDRDTSVLGTGLRGFSAASGGIASLTKTIPPKSGPTPHGLRYVYNNVKKIKE